LFLISQHHQTHANADGQRVELGDVFGDIVMSLVKKQAIFLQNRRIFRIFADVLSTKIVSTKKTKN
jgi:hypothetical protein